MHVETYCEKFYSLTILDGYSFLLEKIRIISRISENIYEDTTHHMARQPLVTRKRKSKRIRAKKKFEKPILAEVNVPVRASKRLVPKERESLAARDRSASDSRPIRYQSFVLPNEYTCADFTEGQCKKWNVYSCFCCDNYRKDRDLVLKGRCQENVNSKKYGCRRKKGIQIRVKLSSSFRSANKNKDTATVGSKVILSAGADSTDSTTSGKVSGATKRKLNELMKSWEYVEDQKRLNQIARKLDTDAKLMEENCNVFLRSATKVLEDKLRVKSIELENAKVTEMQQMTSDHKNELLKLKRRCNYLDKKNKKLICKMESKDISFFVNHALKNMRVHKRAELVMDMVMSGDLFGEKGVQASKEIVRKEVRKKFTAWKLCMARDTAHQGCLNLQGIEAVRQVEELENRERGMMPSKSSVWREGDELLREVGYPLFDIQHEETELGEVVKLGFEGVLRFAMHDNGLTAIAQEFSVEFAFSVDAAALSDGTSHIFAALKNVDVRSRDRDGNLMYVKDENGVIKLSNLQSNRNIYIMMMVYARDGKKPHRYFFKEWFDFINKIKKEGLPYRDAKNPAIKPILTRIPQDLSSIQKSVNMGGACKACDLFCHLCACRSYGGNCQLMRWREGHLRCRDYCLSKQNCPSKCFHWEVDDEHEIERKKQVIKSMLLLDEIRYFRLLPDCFQQNSFSARSIKIHYSINEKFSDCHVEEDPAVVQQSQLLTSVTDANRQSDARHINFVCPTQPCVIRTAYNSMLDRELIIRKLFGYCTYPVEIKQKYLLLSVRNGEHIKDLRRAIERWCPIGQNDKMMDVNDAVLCILHLELRCSENKIAHLLNEGFSHRKNKALIDEYKSEIELIVNEGKIGRATHQNQWSFPINKGNDGVANDFSLKGEFGKQILKKSYRLVEVALRYHTQEERNDFNAVLGKYEDVLKFMNRRTFFDESTIQEFQSLADEYSAMWRNITGRDGQTNYEHIIDTGHLSHYFRKYGNLYRFSQQGFEAMMSRVKCIYHRCTSRGGHGSKIRSHILQIVHFLIRSMLWNSGHGEAYFHAKYGSKEDKDDLFLNK